MPYGEACAAGHAVMGVRTGCSITQGMPSLDGNNSATAIADQAGQRQHACAYSAPHQSYHKPCTHHSALSTLSGAGACMLHCALGTWQHPLT